MSNFVQGQRWVVDSEPELGLGTVVSVTGRTVNIFFELGDCERCYSIAQAPLTKIQYEVDDEIETADGETHIITAVHEHDGLIIYDTQSEKLIPETALSSSVKLNQPFMRLMTGQLDQPKWFYFKRLLDSSISKFWRSQLNGLLGVRASLVPHQLYVAQSACQKEKVRVLLADEVGLGKTIEAGMILSRLLRQERIERTLILVPDALQVQWFIELARRFNLKPDIYAGAEHEFLSGQIHIVPHSAFHQERDRLLEHPFDLTIVDEAHNIQEHQSDFETLKALSDSSEHLVLLTATPEQLGVKSHFERLKLLDPVKFSDFDQFQAQESHYSALNKSIQSLPSTRDELISTYNLSADLDDQALTHQLLDCHGIGRMMYRNVRKAVAGFPQRIVESHKIESEEWEAKYEWLAQWLTTHDSEKVLVIVHDIQQVFDCEQHLWNKHGIDAAVFHEEQSLIDRDKAAAYFADMENGSRILICSEIGSEGRNFQFCNQLVCLDLPTHPDMLEQRIGRLDRIGQKRDVMIHIPFASLSKSEQYYNWYHQILDCIAQQNPAASTIHNAHWESYQEITGNGDSKAEEELTKQVREELASLRQEIEDGRDALLEINSCRQPEANELAERIQQYELNSPLGLVEMASELFQFHFEESRAGAYNLIPSDKMLIPALPGIPPEGTEVTFDRDIANSREDFTFLTWDSQFISGLWELLHHSELGTASVAMLPSRQLPAGQCLLEGCYDVVVQAENAANCRPFFDALSLRTVALDISDKDLADALSEESLQNTIGNIKKYLAREIIQSKKADIPTWYKKVEKFAEAKISVITETALASAQAFYQQEQERFDRLNKMNQNFSEDEVIQLQEKADKVINAIKNNVHLRLSAIRLIIVTEPQ